MYLFALNEKGLPENFVVRFVNVRLQSIEEKSDRNTSDIKNSEIRTISKRLSFTM